jgi:hypothetical protein
MTSTRQKLISKLIIIVLLTITVRLPWLFMIPAFEAPDENPHLWVIQYCAQHLSLPSRDAIYASGADASYGSIPQFGYVPHVFFLKILPNLNPRLAARYASLLMASILNVTAYLIAQEIFLANMLLTLAVPAMLIFHPELVFVGSYANNDITVATLSSIVLLLLIRTIKQGLTWHRSLWIGFLSGWILLSKYTGTCVIPTALVFLSLAAWLHRCTLKSYLVHLGSAILIFLATCAWWFIRSYYVFNGDISGVGTLYYTWASSCHKSLTLPYKPVLEVISKTRWWRMNFYSYWAVFGYMIRFVKTFFYFVYLGFVAISAIGGLTTLKRIVHSGSELFARSQADASKFPRQELIPAVIWSMFLSISLLNIIASALGSCSGVSGPQGRYFFPSEVALISLLLAGLYQFKGVWGKGLVLTLLAYNFYTYLFCLRHIYLLYVPNFPFGDFHLPWLI